MANFNKIAKMGILVWVDMAKNMVNRGVSAKNWLKSYGQNKLFFEKRVKVGDLLCIFVRNLKWMATSLGWWENSQVFAQPWLAHHKGFQNFNFQDTLMFCISRLVRQTELALILIIYTRKRSMGRPAF